MSPAARQGEDGLSQEGQCATLSHKVGELPKARAIGDQQLRDPGRVENDGDQCVWW